MEKHLTIRIKKKIRKRNIRFNTNHSDTEVILNGIDHSGVNFIEEPRGQFAIFYINFDQNKQSLQETGWSKTFICKF